MCFRHVPLVLTQPVVSEQTSEGEQRWRLLSPKGGLQLLQSCPSFSVLVPRSKRALDALGGEAGEQD